MAARQGESRYGLRDCEHAALADVALPARRQVEALQRWRYDVCCALLMFGGILAAWCILERAAGELETLAADEEGQRRWSNLLRQANEYAVTFHEGDFEAMIEHLPEELIEWAGGKDL